MVRNTPPFCNHRSGSAQCPHRRFAIRSPNFLATSTNLPPKRQSIRTTLVRLEASRPWMRRPSRSRSARHPARHACQRIDKHSLAVCASADCHQIPGRAARHTPLEYPAHPSCLLREAERDDASPATPAPPVCRGTAANARRRDGARIWKSNLSRSRSPRRMGTDIRVGSPTRAPVPLSVSRTSRIDPSRPRPRTGRPDSRNRSWWRIPPAQANGLTIVSPAMRWPA